MGKTFERRKRSLEKTREAEPEERDEGKRGSPRFGSRKGWPQGAGQGIG